MNMTSAAASVVGGILAVLIVGGAVVESVTRGTVEPALLVMATAVVGVFFTGQAIRSSNGIKMDALANAVNSVHARLDAAGIASSGDGTTGGAA
ncbi:MAG: hypothetical protein KGL54_10790 [Sphingomonadales bacterium]|nr:hypothetical protein [Sphingomonadales bacterium]